MPAALPGGPLFLPDSEEVAVRIRWTEFRGARDGSVPVEPDIIEIALWPNE
jgi:hypothetical protein